MKRTEVLVIGGGFGGVYATRALLKKGYKVTLISKTNFFIFTPLLHEVATGSLNSNDVTFEYSDFFRNKKFTFFRENIIEVNFEERYVVTSDGERVTYDYLIYSTGSTTNFYGASGQEFALELKSIEDAGILKRRIVTLAQGIERDIVINVVGGGPTGVELAFELEEFLEAVKRHSPTLNYTLRLLHAGDVLCGTFPKDIQNYALREMRKEGIEVRLNTTVQEIVKDGVITKEGEKIPGDLTIWTAGVTPQTSCIDLKYKDERGNIIVDKDLRIVGREREFALGDIITHADARLPKLAQTATKQGPIAARNIDLLERGLQTKHYEPKISGSLISLGKGRGAGKLFGITFKGFLGWFIWKSAYLSKIPGFRNKSEVSITWLITLFSSRDLFER